MRVLQHKVVASLPVPLQPNSIYYVRKGTGFDINVTNDAGIIVAYSLNANLALEGKVDKEAGYSLLPDTEITRLATIHTGATKNRADSENADKIHTHSPVEVGLGDVDNTSDEDKPLSRAHREAMDTKFNSDDVAQGVGNSSTKVMSQKSSTEAFYRAGSGVMKAGKIHVQSTAPTVDVEDGDIWLKI